LKRQLRELYKRVHPDRFHSHPIARDANEKSFKLLQARSLAHNLSLKQASKPRTGCGLEVLASGGFALKSHSPMKVSSAAKNAV